MQCAESRSNDSNALNLDVSFWVLHVSSQVHLIFVAQNHLLWNSSPTATHCFLHISMAQPMVEALDGERVIRMESFVFKKNVKTHFLSMPTITSTVMVLLSPTQRIYTLL